MLTSNIYVEAANGFRLYTVLGTTDSVARDAREGGLAKFTAAFVGMPDPVGEGEEQPKPGVELRTVYVDASRIRVIEQAAGWPSDFEIIDSTGNERVEQGDPVPT